MRRDYDYAVLGLGGLGSAAAYWLARRKGRDVLGLEQFALGHDRGESQDSSRIFRLSYDTVPYVRLALEAREAWRALEAEAREEVIIRTGGLDLWPPDTTLDLARYQAAMRASGVAFEMLDAGGIMRRYPQLRVGGDVAAMLQEDGGIAAAARANAAHQRLAREHGATLMERTGIDRIRAAGGLDELHAGGTVYSCRRLVVAAGPWTNAVLRHLGLTLPLKVTKEQVTYFAPSDPAMLAPGRLPVWIWMIAVNYYGFPVFEGALKAARDRFEPVDPDTRGFDADPLNELDVESFLGRLMPGAAAGRLRTRTCILTHTPDTDLVLDELPGHPGAYAVVGAAHAFKFASVIGRILAGLAIDGHATSDISPFRFARPALARRTFA